MGPYGPYFPKMTSQISWLLIGGEDLRKIFGKRRQGFGNRREFSARVRESSGIFGNARGKTQGGVGGGRQERKREGWVGGGRTKKVWRVGWVMTSSKKMKKLKIKNKIKKIKKIKKLKN